MNVRHRVVCVSLLVATVALSPQAQDRPEGFHELLRTGDLAALTAALDERPALSTQRDAQGVPPVFWAAVYGHEPLVELLLARGADPRSSTPLGTVLDGAVAGGNPRIVRLLAARGADVNGGGQGSSPLLLAVRLGQLPVIDALLDAGASTAATDAAGNTALIMAASYGLEPVVRRLLTKGADVTVANVHGATPLDVARREEHDTIATLLEARGAVAGTPRVAPPGPYLGQTPPGTTPALFAPGFVSTERRELNAAFTPDRRTLFFARDRGPGVTAILMTASDGKRWTTPVTAPFSRDDAGDVDVFVTADGREVYFCSERTVPGGRRAEAGATPVTAARTADIWMATRTADGWSSPVWLGPSVNSSAADYYPTLTQAGTLYFSSNREGSLGQNDVYRARRVDGAWTAPENLGPPINTSGREFDPFIAPDESYLIFASERPGGLGRSDLYLSVHREDGSWAPPVNLGAPINSSASEYTPNVSPDGRYLFFTSGREGTDDLYWVDAAVIAKAQARGPK